MLQGDILADGSHASNAKRWAAQAEGEAELAAAEAAVRSGHQVGKGLPTPEHCLMVGADDGSYRERRQRHRQQHVSLHCGPCCAWVSSLQCVAAQCMLQGQRCLFPHLPPKSGRLQPV